MAIKKGLLIGIIIAAVVLVIIGVGVGTVLSIHNSTYDCSFVYVQPEDLVKEIVTKYTYYNAATKTVEITLNQDLINSLIKDNFENLDIALPNNFSIKEILFNTKDQRIYINAKYGSINIPISAKVNVQLADDGISISASDLLLGKKKAPGFIANQVPLDQMSFSFNYADFDLPDIFTVKDVQFGSGYLTAYVELKPDAIKSMALEYRNQILSEIDKFKNTQHVLINNFITDVLDSTAILSDAKVNELVDFVLNNGELVNGIIQIALTEDFSVYTKPFEPTVAAIQKEVEETVSELTAPLSVIRYYGSVEETFNKIVYDPELRNLLEMFLPAEQIDEYVALAEEYYAMYEEYYGMYEEILDMTDELGETFASLSFSADSLDTIENTVATLQNKIFRNTRLINLLAGFIPTDTFEDIADTIDEYLAMYHEYLDLYNETLDSIASTVSEIDTSMIDEYADLALDYIAQTDDFKELIIDSVSQIDTQLIKDLVAYFEGFGQFSRDFIATLPEGSYAEFRRVIDDLDLYQADIIALTEDFDPSSVAKNIEVVKQINKDINEFKNEIVSMLENREIVEAVDTIMTKEFGGYEFEVVNLLPSYEIEYQFEWVEE
ncbi:MAG TPA: hypothetical protein GXX37_08180 [Clostridiaceae bacterium]|nr:hypothetical protein [Clostridiaceae bacterium]